VLRVRAESAFASSARPFFLPHPPTQAGPRLATPSDRSSRPIIAVRAAPRTQFGSYLLGRHRTCQTLLPHAYKVSVQPIPQDMKYKSPDDAGGNNAGASYLHYGDPAAQQGDDPQKYSTSTTTIHYSTLTWSWIDVGGGGHNRILLAPDQGIRLCDVEQIRRDSWAPSSVAPAGQVNGWVIARYVQTHVDNGPALYGWMVWQHHFDGDGNNPDGTPVVVNHFTTS